MSWTFDVRVITLACAGLLGVACMTSAFADVAEELELITLWKLHIADPARHAECIAACDAFEKKVPPSPFLALAREWAAWHRMKSGATAAARTIFEGMLATDSNSGPAAPETALQRGAADIARAWLTRLDREVVKAALKTYYLANIEYPDSLSKLETLPPEDRPLMTDRWGKPWSYRLVAFTRLPGVHGQKYELLSRMLDTVSDLDASLALPYAGTIGITPVRLVSGAPGRESLEFEQKLPGGGTERAVLSAGSRNRGELVAYIGSRVVVVCNHSYWKVLPRPAGGR